MGDCVLGGEAIYDRIDQFAGRLIGILIHQREYFGPVLCEGIRTATPPRYQRTPVLDRTDRDTSRLSISAPLTDSLSEGRQLTSVPSTRIHGTHFIEETPGAHVWAAFKSSAYQR